MDCPVVALLLPCIQGENSMYLISLSYWESIHGKQSEDKMLSWVNELLLVHALKKQISKLLKLCGQLFVLHSIPAKSENLVFQVSHFAMVTLHWSMMYSFPNPLTEILNIFVILRDYVVLEHYVGYP